MRPLAGRKEFPYSADGTRRREQPWRDRPSDAGLLPGLPHGFADVADDAGSANSIPVRRHRLPSSPGFTDYVSAHG